MKKYLWSDETEPAYANRASASRRYLRQIYRTLHGCEGPVCDFNYSEY